MSQVAERRKAEQIDAVAQAINERLDSGRAEAVERFARRFYAHVPPDDIASTAMEPLYGAVLSVWQLYQHRLPGRA